MNKSVIITICGRAGSKGFKNKNLKTFCAKPLAHYSMSAADLFMQKHPELDVDIVVNTDSMALYEIINSKYPEAILIKRPEELAGDRIAKMEVFQHSIKYMEEKLNKTYDYLIDLDITSPLRTAEDISGCYEYIESRPDLDLVLTAAQSRRNPYMNMAQKVDDHAEQVIKTRVTARQMAPVCYDINASIYVFRREFLRSNKSGYLWDGKVDVYEMEDTGILDIDSEEDFMLMEVIADYLFKNNENFAKVRNNIR